MLTHSLFASMLPCTSAFVLTIASLASAAAAERTYVNDRYHYRISYPADRLTPGPEADNGDGVRFHSRDGEEILAVWGSWKDVTSPEEEVRSAQGDCGGGKVTYQIVKERLAAISCITPKGQIIYEKSIFRGDTVAVVRFEYPAEERATWDPIVRRVADSLAVED